MPELTTVRRFEAAGFRAWPAGSVHYDGTWAIRLTPAHAGRRLNSINPLDPRDVSEIGARLERAAKHFEAAGRTTTMRLSPLAAKAIADHLDGLGWPRFAESAVMRLDLDDAVVEAALDQIPLKDVGRFVAAAISVRGQDASQQAGLADVIGSIEPEAGLFVLEQDGRPLATAICVHDGELAGLFEVATAAVERGRGYGRRVVLSALKWARMRGARIAWLQVEADNEPALKLYDTLGFREIYRYHYRQPPEDRSL
ncbi:GNAT family N-acetyltransferase [Kumtagia ephedrae]|jgi:ribosomal protein S18 acetylase RimI-like enzyme|uniref:GNAT family N-acetyltransferase n=1 Tax=Kumtagia ephedrae TaxID=2116701 RepID=A0A2P7RKP7_9HYPH|nr:GNAT family N-acetyltransferase [Mesorhizobium ephedrae]PSJ50791.1 GNAT family N-acetyltransferase [Mesorhizobium ephedrae]